MEAITRRLAPDQDTVLILQSSLHVKEEKLTVGLIYQDLVPCY